MTRAEVTQIRPGLVAFRLALLLAAAGCSDGDYGTVSSTPKSSPEVVQAAPPRNGAPAPRVPRGPGPAKALQDATAR